MLWPGNKIAKWRHLNEFQIWIYLHTLPPFLTLNLFLYVYIKFIIAFSGGTIYTPGIYAAGYIVFYTPGIYAAGYIVFYYTPGIYAAGYIVFALTFVRSSVRVFVCSFVCSLVPSFVCSFVRYFPSRS